MSHLLIVVINHVKEIIVVQLKISVELIKEIVILIINANMAWYAAQTIVSQIQSICQMTTAALLDVSLIK